MVIGYDARAHPPSGGSSKRFASLAAAVFISRGVPVHLFSDITPTPFVVITWFPVFSSLCFFCFFFGMLQHVFNTVKKIKANFIACGYVTSEQVKNECVCNESVNCNVLQKRNWSQHWSQFNRLIFTFVKGALLLLC